MIKWNEGIFVYLYKTRKPLLKKNYNTENKIKFMRISSDIFPFASHEKAG